MANDSNTSQSNNRSNLVAVVKTPMAWFTLVVLVAEGILLAVLAKADSTQKMFISGGMLLVLLVLIGVVAFLAYYHPEVLNLKGAIWAFRATNVQFFRKIKGAWWEKINQQEGSALSFFTITADPLTRDTVFQGTSYGKNGQRCATWESEMTRLYPTDRKITYVWHGKRPFQDTAHFDFHGYGTMEFLPPSEGSSTQLTRGRGDFWDVDESQPGKTVFKSIELHRVLDKQHRKIMTSGSDKEKPDLVMKVIETW
jgi:hypothetical protein